MNQLFRLRSSLKPIQYFILVIFLSTSFLTFGQLTLPDKNPKSQLFQTVGLTDIYIEYSRPSKQGRSVFGELVPFNSLWGIGTDENTIIEFGDDIIIDGKELKAGKYALFAKPNITSWEIIFYVATENKELPKKWEAKNVKLRTQVDVAKTARVIETFTISIDNISNNSGVLGIRWDNTYVGIKFEVPTKSKTLKNIERTLSGPTINDYYTAASYYFDEGLDLQQAKEWINKAVSLDKDNKAFWIMRTQSLIYAKLGDTKNAIRAAKKSLAAAESIYNYNQAYVIRGQLHDLGYYDDEIYCCSNHEEKHCAKSEDLPKLRKELGCEGF